VSPDPNSPTEHQIQCSVIDWRNTMQGKHPLLRWLHSIPNGANLTLTEARWQVREGMTSGVPDLCLPVTMPKYSEWGSRGGVWAGLYIEVKTETGRFNANQKEWLAGLKANGFRAEMRRGVDPTIDLICEYLGIEYRGY